MGQNGYPIIKKVTMAAVHKLHRTNQLVYEIIQTGPGKFRSKIRIPTHHAFFNDHTSGLLAEAYLVEVMRQNIWPIVHQFLDIPLKSPATASIMGWKFYKKATPGSTSGLLEVETILRGPEEIKPGIDTYESESLARCENGTTLANFYGTFHMSKEKLDSETAKVRPGETPAIGQLVDPAKLGMFNRKSVLIANPDIHENSGKINLAIDLEQSFYFEHYGLHVSGPMLMEAGRQAAIYFVQEKFHLSSGYLKEAEIRFSTFVTLRDPVDLEFEWKEPTRGCGQMTANVTILYKQKGAVKSRMNGIVAFEDQKEE